MGGPERGTAKIVPVVVSAGLAVGVFCGLLFGLGTRRGNAAARAVPAAPAHGTNVKEKVEPPAPEPPPQPSGATQAGSAAAGGSDAQQTESPKLVKLTVVVRPDAAGAVAKIQIDGKEVAGNSVELPAESKSAKVAITAPGYHSQDKIVDVSGGDTTLEIELLKRAAPAPSSGADKPAGHAPASGGAGNSGSTGKGSGSKKPAGGALIDL
jgi:hypothetical protein